MVIFRVAWTCLLLLLSTLLGVAGLFVTLLQADLQVGGGLACQLVHAFSRGDWARELIHWLRSSFDLIVAVPISCAINLDLDVVRALLFLFLWLLDRHVHYPVRSVLQHGLLHHH